MKPWKTLDRARAPDGAELILQERDGEFVIRADGHALMSSRAHGSEEALAQLGCGPLTRSPDARVLVGGLGLGYTLRASLDLLPPTARVVVAEIAAAVVAWNRGPLAPLAGSPLADPRVQVEEEDVGRVLARAAGAAPKLAPFDAVLMDVDNGPAALTRPANRELYGQGGLTLARRALTPGGALVVWSASPDPAFVERLRATGFTVSTREVPSRTGKNAGTKHTVFVGLR